MAILSVDAGTSVIKTVAFAEDGRELALARAETVVLHPTPERSEQSMEDVWQAVVKTVVEVRGKVAEEITGLCITAQGDGCWMVDVEGRPTGNALLWNDGRAGAIVERWRTAGALDRARAISGSVSYPGLSNALLAWLREQDTGRVQRSRWVLSCNGYLFSRLTGQMAADLSDGSNPFGDVRARAYSDQVFEMCGLASLRSLFPEIAQGASLQQPLTAVAAEALGLPAGTPVVMAPYDIVSTAYGAGVTSPGRACLILGTTICAETIVADWDASAPGDGTTLALEEDLFLRAMPTLAGCETLQWAAGILGVTDLVALGELAQTAEPGAGGLLFLPYLSEAGERAPFLDPAASGSWHNLKLTHRREHLARAVYEGLSFAIRDCLQAAGGASTEVSVCGGGAQSDFWCQMIADVTGLQVSRPAASELGARGAFLFSRVITGDFVSLTDASAALPVASTTFSPDAERGGLYARRFEEFLQTRNAVRALWPQAARRREL